MSSLHDMQNKNTDSDFIYPDLVSPALAEDYLEIHLDPKTDQLLIGDSLFGNFKHSSNLVKHMNGLFGFQPKREDDGVYKMFIDPENLEKNFPVVLHKNKHVFVNNNSWDTLLEKNIYSNGLLAVADPITESVVIYTTGDDTYENNKEIIVNNVPWAHTFFDVRFVEIFNDTVLVVGNKKRNEESLFVNDKEWIWPYSHNQEVRSTEHFKYIKTNGEVVVGVVASERFGKKLQHVFVGDQAGYKIEWNTAFDTSPSVVDVCIGEDINKIAVLGFINKTPVLVINDIICKLTSVPSVLEKIRFDEGSFFVQYIDTIGERHAERVTLVENATSVQEKLKKNESIDDALYILRKVLHEKKITPSEIIELSLRHQNLKVELLKKEREANKVYELENKNNTVNSENSILRSSLARAKEENIKLNERINSVEKYLADVERIVALHEPKRGIFAKKTGIKKEVHSQLLSALGKTIKKEEKKPKEKPVKVIESKKNVKKVSDYDEWFK